MGMRNRHLAAAFFAAGITLLAGACSLPLLQSAPAQATHSYVLEWHGGGEPRVEAPRRDSLLISPVLSTPGFDGSDMAYVRTAHEIDQA